MTELQGQIKDLKDWQERGGRLCASFKFKDFTAAFAFICQVALLAEKLQHHPKLTSFYNLVEIELWTHNHNAIRPKDVEMAREISAFYASS